MSMIETVKKVGQGDSARRITRSFTGVGLVGQEGRVWVIASGVRMPPALEANSEPHRGTVPYDAVVFDQEARAAYDRANQPRAELAAPVKRTREDIMQTKGWSDMEWSQAVATGFPKACGYRETYDRDGYPAGRLSLWAAEDVQKWEQALATLRLR